MADLKQYETPLDVDEVDGNMLGTVKEAIAVVKKPINETIIKAGFSQSQILKNLVGWDYEQMQQHEPEVEKLKLTFMCPILEASFKIGNVAELLPKAPGYKIDEPLIIFIHGFTDNPTQCNFGVVNEALQSQDNYNILALDASSLIDSWYLRSSTYVRFIGEKLGESLADMVKSGLKPKNIYLVGHSLGAHIAGFTGKTFFALTGSLVGRISGLDPAGPAFNKEDSSQRLASTDAEFVDVIHTNAGVYGISSPVGHVDFFPNGGKRQPNSLLESHSHSRVVELFAESVRNPEAFPARASNHWKEFKKDVCDGDLEADSDVVYMGYGCSRDSSGRYYLRTGGETPYSMGMDGLKGKKE